MSDYELPMSFKYVKDMDTQCALREILQNAKDQEQVVPENKLEIKYLEDEEKLLISNKKSVLDINTLVLGESTKQEDSDTIGQFGEGYKLALLILTRENKPVTIYNYGNKEIWKVSERKSRKWKSNILLVKVTKAKIWETVPDNNLTFEIGNITSEDYEEFIKNSLDLKNVSKIKTSMGDILDDSNEKGRIYVNGLFITSKDKLEYGYNILPRYLRIGRDRDLIDEFDLFNITSQMILEGLEFSKALEIYHKDNADDLSCLSTSIFMKGLSYNRDSNDNVKTYESVQELNKNFAENYYKDLKEKYKNGKVILADLYEDCPYEKVGGITVKRLNSDLVSEIRELDEYKNDYREITKSIIIKDEDLDKQYAELKDRIKYKLTNFELEKLDHIIDTYKSRLK